MRYLTATLIFLSNHLKSINQYIFSGSSSVRCSLERKFDFYNVLSLMLRINVQLMHKHNAYVKHVLQGLEVTACRGTQ